MHTEIISRYEELLKLEKDWNRLLNSSFHNVIFLTFEWLSSWWEHFGKDNELFIILVKEREELIAIAPLMIKQNNYFNCITTKKLQFIAHNVSDYMDFIVSKSPQECFKEIFSEISLKKKKWDYAEFMFIASSSPFLQYWQENINGLKIFIKFINKKEASLKIDMYKNINGWDAFKRTISEKRINNLNRSSNNLKKIGTLRFNRMRTFSEIKSKFSYFTTEFKKRCEKTGLEYLFDDPIQVNYYLTLAHKFSENSWFELSSLELNSSHIAMAIGYIYKGVYYYYLPTFNQDYHKYSPGNLLIKYLIEDFYIEGQIKIFDLLRGKEPYKYIWSNNETCLIRIKIFPFKIKSILIYFCSTVLFLKQYFYKPKINIK